MPNAPILDPTVISVDSLDDLVNRFGGDDDKTLAKPTATSSASTSTSSSTTHNNSQCIGIGYEVCSILLLYLQLYKFKQYKSRYIEFHDYLAPITNLLAITF